MTGTVSDIQFLGGRGGDADGAPAAAPYEAGAGAMADEISEFDAVDDLPF